MNFLAHAYFSPKDTGVLCGNLLGDTFKGRIELMQLPENIKAGLKLHRELDSYCDSLDAFKKSKVLLKEYGLFAGAIVDVINDHFLAIHWDKYSNIPLGRFSKEVYKRVEVYDDYLSQEGKALRYYMSEGDWLYKYRKKEFIVEVLIRMSKRTKRRGIIQGSKVEFYEKYNEFEENFFEFIEEMKKKFESSPDGHNTHI